MKLIGWSSCFETMGQFPSNVKQDKGFVWNQFRVRLQLYLADMCPICVDILDIDWDFLKTISQM